MSNLALPPGLRWVQWLTLWLSFAAIMLLMLWPTPLSGAGDSQPLGHGQVSLLFGGLCLGVVVGSGMLQHQPRWQWWLALLCSWVALLMTAALTLSGL